MSAYNGQEVSLSLRFNQFNLMVAGDKGTSEHEETDVGGDGGMHATTGRTPGTRKLTTDKDG